MTRRPSSRCDSIVAAKAWPRGPAPATRTNRPFMPRLRRCRNASRRMARVTRATTNCVGKRMRRKRRLTSGSLNQKRTANVVTAMSAVARTRSQRLRADGPARPRSVEAVERQRHDPAHGVEHQERHRVRDDLPPPDGPVLAEAHDGQGHQDDRREDAVREHEQQAQGRRVAPDHDRATLGKWCVRAMVPMR